MEQHILDAITNYIRERCANSNIEVLTPLWGCDRDTLIYQLLKCKFHVIFSCVKKPHFTCDWLGKPLDIDSLDRLRKMSAEKNFDICGEGGEYHTLVLDGPIFKKRIEIGSHAKHVLGDMMYLKPRDVILREK